MLLDIDYVASEDQKFWLSISLPVIAMEGRRYSDGLHQAIEPKKVCRFRKKQKLQAATYQNLFRMYKKLSGTAGTAKTEGRRIP